MRKTLIKPVLKNPANVYRLKPSLSLFDAVSLMVSIVIGVGIFETTPDIAAQLPSITAIFGVWIFGALLSLCGALCYAELIATHPENGGDYIYLQRAFGTWLGFVFAWGRITIVQPGIIAAMAFPFAHFTIKSLALILNKPIGDDAVLPVAIIGILALTLLSCLGGRTGTKLQNALTVLKVFGLILISATAFLAPSVNSVSPVIEDSFNGFGIALILVMFTFGGWSDIAYVAAEVEHNQRNIPRAIIAAVVLVTLLYLFANTGFLWALGHNGVAVSNALAVDALQMILPHYAQIIVAALIAISALGAINAMLFTGARIGHSLGTDFPPFRWLAIGYGTSAGPLVSLLFLSACSIGILLIMGSFERTVVYTTPVVWLFYLLSTLALFMFRKKSTETRLFSVPFYPVIPICFAMACLYMCYSAIEYDLTGSSISIGILLLGIPLYTLAKKRPPH
ncbi:MAG: amino acid permease [Methylococcales bacterium]